VCVNRCQNRRSADSVEGVGKVQFYNARITSGRIQKSPDTMNGSFSPAPDAEPELDGGKQFGRLLLRGRARRFGECRRRARPMAIGRNPPSFLRKAIKLAPKKRC